MDFINFPFSKNQNEPYFTLQAIRNGICDSFAAFRGIVIFLYKIRISKNKSQDMFERLGEQYSELTNTLDFYIIHRFLKMSIVESHSLLTESARNQQLHACTADR